VYGVVEPESGDNFSEISHLDTECFQEFLNDFQDGAILMFSVV